MSGGLDLTLHPEDTPVPTTAVGRVAPGQTNLFSPYLPTKEGTKSAPSLLTRTGWKADANSLYSFPGGREGCCNQGSACVWAILSKQPTEHSAPKCPVPPSLAPIPERRGGFLARSPRHEQPQEQTQRSGSVFCTSENGLFSAYKGDPPLAW